MTHRGVRDPAYTHAASKWWSPDRLILRSLLLITVLGQLQVVPYGSSIHNKRRLGHNEVREVSRAGRGKVRQAQALEFYAESNQDSLKTYQENDMPGFSLAHPISRTRLLVMNPNQ